MNKKPHNLFCCLAALLLLVSPAAAQTTVLFEGFESKTTFTNEWLTESNYPDEEDPVLWGVVNKGFGSGWISSPAPAPRTGIGMAYCAAIGYWGTTNKPVYPNDVSTFMSREIDLSNFRSATLTFWFQSRIFAGTDDDWDEFFSDYLTVYIDDEAIYSTWDLDPEEGEIKTWRKVTINLEGYAGKVCNLKFEFESDISSQDDPLTARMGVLIDDVLVTGYPYNRPDYNKDGWLDLLFQHTDTRVAIWYFTNYTAFKGSAYLRDGKKIPGTWRLSGQTDFNGDGKSDVFWKNDKGETLAWLMDGTNYLGYIPMKKAPLGWNVGTLADFNNDGTQDILWQHDDTRLAVWYMSPTNPAVVSHSVALPKAAGENWRVVGSGDFNYDGKRDLILQSTRYGTLRVRYLGINGVDALQTTDPQFTRAQGIVFSKEWRMVGTQDFNGSGEPDLIMHHTDGTIAIWHLDGLKITGQTVIRKVPVAWNILGHR